MKQYDTYKDSGVQWIGEIPSHWHISRLKFIIQSLGSGGTPQSTNPLFYSDDGTPWVTINDMSTSDYVCETAKQVTREGIADKSLTIYPSGTMLYSIYATLGKVSVLKVPATINQAILALVLSKRNDQNFIRYNLKAMEDWIFSLSNGNTQFNLSANKVSNFNVIIPPLKEQKAIAEWLDVKCGEIDKVIATQQRRIDLLQELRQSIITRAVTHGINPDVPMKPSGIDWIGDIPAHWELRKLKNICKSERYSIKTGPFGSQLKGQDLQPDGDVRVYNQRNVIDNDFDNIHFYVSHDKAKDLESFYTQPNDLLITSRGTIGKCSILPDDALMGILHPCLIALRINTSICELNWAQNFIGNSSCFSTNVFLNSNATTIEVIYTETLKSVAIPIPPIDEQLVILKHIEREIAKVDAAIDKAERQIALLQELRQSVITEVVTGKRKVC